jgi:CRP-like cAMP-binding protein
MRVDLIRQLDELAISMPVGRGSLIFRSGAPALAVYVVRSGKIVRVWRGPDQVYPMDALGPGSIMGLSAALNGEYIVTAKAVEDSELGFISVNQVIAMFESSPRLARAATELTAQEAVRMQLPADPGNIRPARGSETAKGSILPIRFSSGDRKRVETAARANGQSVSEWVRSTLSAAIGG